MFLSITPYEPRHPKALAVYCSDGRFTQAVEELCHHLGHERLDTLTMPGGPALLNPWTASILEADQVTSRAREQTSMAMPSSRPLRLEHWIKPPRRGAPLWGPVGDHVAERTSREARRSELWTPTGPRRGAPLRGGARAATLHEHEHEDE